MIPPSLVQVLQDLLAASVLPPIPLLVVLKALSKTVVGRRLNA